MKNRGKEDNKIVLLEKISTNTDKQCLFDTTYDIELSTNKTYLYMVFFPLYFTIISKHLTGEVQKRVGLVKSHK